MLAALTVLSTLLHVPSDGPDARVVAVVRRVTLHDFPDVRLQLEIEWPPVVGEYRTALPKGKVLDGSVRFPRQAGAISFQDPAVQQRLVARYLQPGDRVHASLTKSGNDWLIIDLGRVSYDWQLPNNALAAPDPK